MRLSSIDFGAPFIYRENPDVKPRLFYKLYPHFPLGKHHDIKYECYEVVMGCLQSPAFMISEYTIVEPYKFNKNVKK